MKFLVSRMNRRGMQASFDTSIDFNNDTKVSQFIRDKPTVHCFGECR